jgi:RHS repeat-associated protein
MPPDVDVRLGSNVIRLGSTTGLADAGGSVTDSYEYDVFGAVRSHVGTSGNEWRFTGELQDSRVARGMYYLRARYYDPALGRFIRRDPFAGVTTDPQTLNRYPYVLNNPALLIDPYGYWGLPSWDDVKDAAGDLGGAVADKAGDAAEWLSDPENLVNAVQTGSGLVATASCAYGIGGGTVCVVSLGIYGLSSVVEVAMADSTPKRISSAGSALIGACSIPVGRVEGAVVAGLNGMWDAMTDVSTAEAPGLDDIRPGSGRAIRVDSSGRTCSIPVITGEKYYEP